jgi:hypothetical protein
LRAIRGTLTDYGERLDRNELHLYSLGQQVGALTTVVYTGKSETDALRRRVERIEQRLNLRDA